MIQFFATTITLFVLDYFFHFFGITDIKVYFILGFCYTVLVKIIKPLVKLISLPFNIVTLGLVSLIINTVITMLLFKYFGINFTFTKTLLISIIISFVSAFVTTILEA